MMIFSKTMFQKDVYKFFKREGMYKRFSDISKFMYKGICFNDFFQCLFKRYVQRFFQIYIFYVHAKGFFNDFFCLNAYVQRIKKISRICTNFKVKICTKVFLFRFSKFHCVES